MLSDYYWFNPYFGICGHIDFYTTSQDTGTAPVVVQLELKCNVCGGFLLSLIGLANHLKIQKEIKPLARTFYHHVQHI